MRRSRIIKTEISQDTAPCKVKPPAECRQAEEELRKLSRVVEESPTTVVITDTEGNIEYVNPRFTQLTGYTFEEVKGKNPRVLKSGHTPAKVYKKLWETVMAGKEWRGEFLNIKKNGELYWESAIISPLLDDSDRITNLIAIKEDITERKQVEEALRVSNERLTLAQKAGGIGVFDWDMITNRMVWTPELEAIFGIPAGQFKNTFEDWAKRVYPADMPRIEQYFKDWTEAGRDSGELEYRILRAGEIRWIASRGRAFYDQNGVPLRMIGTNQDITERRRAEETLRRQAALIDLSPDAIFVRSLEGTITFWGHGAESLYGWKRYETIGKVSYTLLQKQLPQPLEEINRQLSETGLWSGEVTHTARDGRQITVQSRWLAQFDKEGRITEVMESNVDITERKQAEQALADAKDQAELYVDIMGHDINNLNQIALMNLELVRDEPGLPEDATDSVDTAYRAVQSSSVLIENVRKLQKITEGRLEKETVDLNDLVAECAREAPRPAHKVVTISVEPGQPMPVKGTPLMKEIFCNLINNSIKYSDEEVAIDIRPGETTQNGQKYYQVTIADTGNGIPDEVKPRLFTRFQRGTRKAHGKGLGLYIVRTLLERFGGSVKVEDRVPGEYTRGSKFTVSLPASN